jgi:hypothetical protein
MEKIDLMKRQIELFLHLLRCFEFLMSAMSKIMFEYKEGAIKQRADYSSLALLSHRVS